MQIYAYDMGEGKRFRYMVYYTIGNLWCSCEVSEDGACISRRPKRNKPKLPPENATPVRYASLPMPVCQAVAYSIRGRLARVAGNVKKAGGGMM